MFRTSFLLVMSAGLWAFAGAFDAQGDEPPEAQAKRAIRLWRMRRAGRLGGQHRLDTALCARRNFGSDHRRTRRVRPENRLAIGAHRKRSPYYLRMADPNVLEWAFLKEDAPVTAQAVAGKSRGDEIDGLGV